MQIDFSRDVAELESAGKSDVEIALYLSALCNRPLPCGAIIAMASAAQMVYRDLETEKLTGPLAAALKASPNPLAQWFYRHVWMDRREQITLDGSASDVPGVDSFNVVVGFGQLAGQLGAASPGFDQIRMGMIAAAGGLRFPDGVTPAQVAAARAEHEAAEQVAAFERRKTNAAALFAERMTPQSDAAEIMATAWTDAGAE